MENDKTELNVLEGVETEQEQVTYCSHCGTQFREGTKFCSSCGNNLEGNIQNNRSQNVWFKLKPTIQTMAALKNFMINNFELLHVIYLVLFVISLVSIKIGLFMFMIWLFVTYYLCLQDSGELVLNQKFRRSLLNAPDKNQELFNKTMNHTQTVINKAKESTAKSLVRVGDETESVLEGKTNQDELTEEKKSAVVETQQTSTFGVTGFLLFASSLASVFGVLGENFVKNTSASLYQSINSSSQLMSYYERTESLITGNSGMKSQLIQLAGIGLIIFPILILVFGLLNTKFSRMISLLLSLVELGAILYVIHYVSNAVGEDIASFFSELIDSPFHVFGLSAYLLTFGVIGMVVFSFVRYIKR